MTVTEAITHDQAFTYLPEVNTGAHYSATVLSSERITPQDSDVEVRELVLEIDRDNPPEGDKGDTFTYELGQSVGVLAPGSAEFGTEHHLRLYSVADLPENGPSGKPRITLCVRRCFYIDSYSGEEYPGVASNYLCDLKVGDELTLTGPVGRAFEVPEDMDADLILIGTGTGIAPFRALVKHIYRNVEDWTGRIQLFYGARSGIELLYMNDEKNDFAQYYDQATFQAFQALSPRPHWDDPIDWEEAVAKHGEELWKSLGDPKTCVYVAGLENVRPELDKVFAGLAGSEKKWLSRKAELMAGGRWVELLY
jgi:ferredoxin--NADP+ reductase